MNPILFSPSQMSTSGVTFFLAPGIYTFHLYIGEVITSLMNSMGILVAAVAGG
jgi:hypothetical protein